MRKKAMVLAAGLGTRLRPWTLSHPKALVPVGGVPMLRRVIDRLSDAGFDYIVVNAHHFADQIKDFVSSEKFRSEIVLSDESDELLDTGGGILNARRLLGVDGSPFLVHNVDILSDADLSYIYKEHCDSCRDITLLTSDRESSRRLLFDADHRLWGWTNVTTGELKPLGLQYDPAWHSSAFSGIQVMSMDVLGVMEGYAKERAFPVMDFLLSRTGELDIRENRVDGLKLIDIGKPATLSQAESFFVNDREVGQ